MTPSEGEFPLDCIGQHAQQNSEGLMKKNIAILLIILFSFSNFVTASDKPVIKKLNDEYTIVLPVSMQKALDVYDPEFKVRPMKEFDQFYVENNVYKVSEKEFPSAVIGDFNGDNILDAAILGYSKNKKKFIYIMSKGNDFKILEFYDYSDFGPDEAIAYVPPKLYQSDYIEKPLDLKTDAIEWIYYEKGAEIIYYKDGSFLHYATAD